MGNNSSKPKEKAVPTDLEWVISALNALSKISKKLRIDFGARDKRYAWLCNIDVSTWYLKKHLDNIQKKGAKEIPGKIHELADLLDKIFNVMQSVENGQCVSSYKRNGDRPSSTRY